MKSDTVTQSFIQSGLENLQGYYLAGQPVPLRDYPNGEKGFPYVLKYMEFIAFMLPEYQIL